MAITLPMEANEIYFWSVVSCTYNIFKVVCYAFSGGFILLSIMLPTKNKNKTHNLPGVFNISRSEDLSRNPNWKSSFRKAPWSRVPCRDGEKAVWFPRCYSKWCGVMTSKGKSDPVFSEAQVLFCRPFRYVFMFPIGLLTNCASHHWLKSNSSPITKIVSSLNSSVSHWNLCSCPTSCMSCHCTRNALVLFMHHS